MAQEREYKTVQINNDIYSRIEARPEIMQKTITLKAFVNRTLDTAVKTYALLEGAFPGMALMGIEKGWILISDVKNSVIAKIALDKDTDLWYCEQDEVNSCPHILYLNYLPENLVLRDSVQKLEIPKKGSKKRVEA